MHKQYSQIMKDIWEVSDAVNEVKKGLQNVYSMVAKKLYKETLKEKKAKRTIK